MAYISNSLAGYDDGPPQIDASDSVVWSGWYQPTWEECDRSVLDGECLVLPSRDLEVFLYDSVTARISNRDGADSHPQINAHDLVVWEGIEDGDWEIFLDNGSTPVKVFDGKGYRDRDPQINDSGVVVWSGDDGNDWEIFLRRLGDSWQNISNRDGYHDHNPQINDSGFVVWQGDDGNSLEIFLYDGEDVVNISNRKEYNDYRPQINARGSVVRYGDTNEAKEIFLYDGPETADILRRDGYGDYFALTGASDSAIWDRWDGMTRRSSSRRSTR